VIVIVVGVYVTNDNAGNIHEVFINFVNTRERKIYRADCGKDITFALRCLSHNHMRQGSLTTQKETAFILHHLGSRWC
jgi:hypothetical protein